MKTANGNEGLLEVIRSDRGLTVRVLGDGASIILHSEPGEEQSLITDGSQSTSETHRPTL